MAFLHRIHYKLDLWRHSFPRVEAERIEEDLVKNRTKNNPTDN